MKNRDYRHYHHREHHPVVSIGIFFIVLGLALLVATNDMLNLGSVHAYFTWETLLIFIGFILFLNLRFVGGLLMIAAGSWFFLGHYYGELPQFLKTIYWPAVIIILGIAFIISSFFRKERAQEIK